MRIAPTPAGLGGFKPSADGFTTKQPQSNNFIKKDNLCRRTVAVSAAASRSFRSSFTTDDADLGCYDSQFALLNFINNFLIFFLNFDYDKIRKISY